jgi:hypothetical protein
MSSHIVMVVRGYSQAWARRRVSQCLVAMSSEFKRDSAMSCASCISTGQMASPQTESALLSVFMDTQASFAEGLVPPALAGLWISEDGGWRDIAVCLE